MTRKTKITLAVLLVLFAVARVAEIVYVNPAIAAMQGL